MPSATIKLSPEFLNEVYREDTKFKPPERFFLDSIHISILKLPPPSSLDREARISISKIRQHNKKEDFINMLLRDSIMGLDASYLNKNENLTFGGWKQITKSKGWAEGWQILSSNIENNIEACGDIIKKAIFVNSIKVTKLRDDITILEVTPVSKSSEENTILERQSKDRGQNPLRRFKQRYYLKVYGVDRDIVIRDIGTLRKHFKFQHRDAGVITAPSFVEGVIKQFLITEFMNRKQIEEETFLSFIKDKNIIINLKYYPKKGDLISVSVPEANRGKIKTYYSNYRSITTYFNSLVYRGLAKDEVEVEFTNEPILEIYSINLETLIKEFGTIKSFYSWAQEIAETVVKNISLPQMGKILKRKYGNILKYINSPSEATYLHKLASIMHHQKILRDVGVNIMFDLARTHAPAIATWDKRKALEEGLNENQIRRYTKKAYQLFKDHILLFGKSSIDKDIDGIIKFIKSKETSPEAQKSLDQILDILKKKDFRLASTKKLGELKNSIENIQLGKSKFNEILGKINDTEQYRKKFENIDDEYKNYLYKHFITYYPNHLRFMPESEIIKNQYGEYGILEYTILDSRLYYGNKILDMYDKEDDNNKQFVFRTHILDANAFKTANMVATPNEVPYMDGSSLAYSQFTQFRVKLIKDARIQFLTNILMYLVTLQTPIKSPDDINVLSILKPISTQFGDITIDTRKHRERFRQRLFKLSQLRTAENMIQSKLLGQLFEGVYINVNLKAVNEEARNREASAPGDQKETEEMSEFFGETAGGELGGYSISKRASAQKPLINESEIKYIELLGGKLYLGGNLGKSSILSARVARDLLKMLPRINEYNSHAINIISPRDKKTGNILTKVNENGQKVRTDIVFEIDGISVVLRTTPITSIYEILDNFFKKAKINNNLVFNVSSREEAITYLKCHWMIEFTQEIMKSKKKPILDEGLLYEFDNFTKDKFFKMEIYENELHPDPVEFLGETKTTKILAPKDVINIFSNSELEKHIRAEWDSTYATSKSFFIALLRETRSIDKIFDKIGNNNESGRFIITKWALKKIQQDYMETPNFKYLSYDYFVKVYCALFNLAKNLDPPYRREIGGKVQYYIKELTLNQETIDQLRDIESIDPLGFVESYFQNIKDIKPDEDEELEALPSGIRVSDDSSTTYFSPRTWHNNAVSQCKECGATFSAEKDKCPKCGSETIQPSFGGLGKLSLIPNYKTVANYSSILRAVGHVFIDVYQGTIRYSAIKAIIEKQIKDALPEIQQASNLDDKLVIIDNLFHRISENRDILPKNITEYGRKLLNRIIAKLIAEIAGENEKTQDALWGLAERERLNEFKLWLSKNINQEHIITNATQLLENFKRKEFDYNNLSDPQSLDSTIYKFIPIRKDIINIIRSNIVYVPFGERQKTTQEFELGNKQIFFIDKMLKILDDAVAGMERIDNIKNLPPKEQIQQIFLAAKEGKDELIMLLKNSNVYFIETQDQDIEEFVRKYFEQIYEDSENLIKNILPGKWFKIKYIQDSPILQLIRALRDKEVKVSEEDIDDIERIEEVAKQATTIINKATQDLREENIPGIEDIETEDIETEEDLKVQYCLDIIEDLLNESFYENLSYIGLILEYQAEIDSGIWDPFVGAIKNFKAEMDDLMMPKRDAKYQKFIELLEKHLKL